MSEATTIQLNIDEIMRLWDFVLDAYWAGARDAGIQDIAHRLKIQAKTVSRLEATMAATFQIKEE